MKKVEIYEPAGCAGGACDPMIEADLIRKDDGACQQLINL